MAHKIALFFLLIVVMVCFIGPLFIEAGEYEIFYDDTGTKILSLQESTLQHPLGTDKSGRDVFVRLLYGGRLSLLLAAGVMLLQTLIGITAGLLAGSAGRKTDLVIMRIVDVFNALPDIVVILILSALFMAYGVSGKERILMLMVFLAAFGWTFIAKIVRSQVLYTRESSFMMAAELCGIPALRRLFVYLLPNVLGQVFVAIPISIGNIILTEATLSFLGFGLPYPYASWGNMLNEAMDYNILANHANVWFPPGLLIVLTVMAFHLVGQGLQKGGWKDA